MIRSGTTQQLYFAAIAGVLFILKTHIVYNTTRQWRYFM